MTIYVSNSGWGATLGSRSTSGRWSTEESQCGTLLPSSFENKDHCSPHIEGHTCTKRAGQGPLIWTDVSPQLLHNINPVLLYRTGTLRSENPLKRTGIEEMVVEPAYLLQLSLVPPLRLTDSPKTMTDLSSGSPLPSLSRLAVWGIFNTGSDVRERIRPWRDLSVTLGEAPQRNKKDVRGDASQNGVMDMLYIELARL